MKTWISDRVGIAATCAAIIALLAVLAVVRFTDVEQLVPGIAADCTLEKGGRTTELSQAEAEALTRAAADGDGERLPPASLSCIHGGADDEEPDRLDRRGLTARAAVVRREILRQFGPQRLGGFARGGVSGGHQSGSAHYEGRAIDVFFRPINPAQRAAGWAMALYLVAHAERLAIDTVIFDDRIWTARRGAEGWRDYDVDTTGRSRRAARILEHRDHVHVDVAD